MKTNDKREFNRSPLSPECCGIYIWIIIFSFIASLIWPDNKVFNYLSFFLTLTDILYFIIAITFILWLTWIYAIPTAVRKIVSIFASVGIAVLILYILNRVFQWGWNFPDVFGVVSGVAGLGFALVDRYLAQRTER